MENQVECPNIFCSHPIIIKNPLLRQSILCDTCFHKFLYSPPNPKKIALSYSRINGQVKIAIDPHFERK